MKRDNICCVYFMYKSNAFKMTPVNRKAKIHQYNNKKLHMTSKEQGIQEELVEFEVSTRTPLRMPWVLNEDNI